MKRKLQVRGIKMFEETASNAAQMLILLFWAAIALTIIFGALWVRMYKKNH